MRGAQLWIIRGSQQVLTKAWPRGMQSGFACLGDSERANKIDFHDLSKLLNRLVHQHCMVGNARIIDQTS